MDLQKTSYRLSVLSTKKPKTIYIQEVEEALQSKYEWIQVCAAKTLGAWGDARSQEKLKTFLTTLSKLRARWGAITAAVDALSPHLSSSDIPWVVNLALRESTPANRHVIFNLFSALPRDELLAEMTREFNKGGIEAGEFTQARVALYRIRTG